MVEEAALGFSDLAVDNGLGDWIPQSSTDHVHVRQHIGSYCQMLTGCVCEVQNIKIPQQNHNMLLTYRFVWDRNRCNGRKWSAWGYHPSQHLGGAFWRNQQWGNCTPCPPAAVLPSLLPSCNFFQHSMVAFVTSTLRVSLRTAHRKLHGLRNGIWKRKEYDSVNIFFGM